MATLLPKALSFDAVDPDDEAMSRWPRWAGRRLVRRLASPAGLLLAALCLVLPFLSGACLGEPSQGVPEQQRQQWRVTYTGVDILIGGQPDVAWADANSQGRLRLLDEADLLDLMGQPPSPLRPQPLAWLAVALIAAALAATALRATRRRAAVTAGLALVAALALYAATLLAREQAVDTMAGVLRHAFVHLDRVAADADQRVGVPPLGPRPIPARVRPLDRDGRAVRARLGERGPGCSGSGPRSRETGPCVAT